jgi:hypothetical protein
VALLTTEEGREGLAVHACNATEAPIEADLERALDATRSGPSGSLA